MNLYFGPPLAPVSIIIIYHCVEKYAIIKIFVIYSYRCTRNYSIIFSNITLSGSGQFDLFCYFAGIKTAWILPDKNL